MPRKPTGRPRGRPPGSGQLDHPKRLNVWLGGETYARLEAYADGRSFARGTPAVAVCARQAIEHFLACPQKHQPQPRSVTDTVTDTDAPQKPPRRRTGQPAPAD
jgi:hypothetical protein